MIAPVALVTQPTLADEATRMITDAGGRVSFMHLPPISEDDLCEALGRDAVNALILRGSPPLTRRVIESAKDLRFIAKHGAGIDSVDIEAATARGIPIVVAAGTNADAVAEMALAMMLSLSRDLPMHDRTLRAGRWEKGSYMGREFASRVVGIVGYGAIGRRTAQLARAFGCRVIAYSRTRPANLEGIEWVEHLDDLYRQADIVSLHCPLSEQTRNMINDRSLALMKPGAILINTARGKLVDEAALCRALSEGRLGAAGLEVFAQEPVDPRNPLLQLPNVISTPHIGPNTEETQVRLGKVTVAQIVDYFRDGTIIESNLVNKAVLERR